MSHHIKVVLPDPTSQQLHELAAALDKPPATLASQLIQTAVAQAARDGQVRYPRQAPALTRHSGNQRASWLEPYGGDPAWRQQMWAAILALHGRYPQQLQYLKDEWWADNATTETLCALAAWRQEIDDTSQDPRDELAFHHQLTDYARTLRQHGGGITNTWNPNLPPEDWIA
jgi:hypothetical protein